MATTDLAQIQHRRDTAANWVLADSLLASGEIGVETDTHLEKLGDGVTLWNALGYRTEQLAKQIDSATSKTTPVDADELPLADSAATFGLKKLTWANLKATLINLGINTQTGTTFTPVLGDNGKLVTLNNAAAIAVTIPTNASVPYPVGAQINFAWITGAGQPTITAVTPGTTTILSNGATPAGPKLRVVNSGATAIKIATDIWLVVGDVA